MKATANSDKKFSPVTLTLVFETQKELDAYATLFRLNPMLQVMEAWGAKFPDLTILEPLGANSDGVQKFAEDLAMTPCMQALFRKLK